MNNEKGNSGVLVVIILVLLGLVVYLGYDKLKFQKTEDDPVQVQEQNQNNEVVKEKTSDERYREYLENLKKELSNKLNNSLGINIWINHLGDAMKGKNVSINSNLELVTDDTVLDKNVLAMFVSNSGNGGYRSLYYIKDDGKVYLIRFTPGAEIDTSFNSTENKCKNIISISNVASMVTNSTIFTDIDGNIYTTSDCY